MKFSMSMKYVTIFFPDNESLADYLIKTKPANAEANSKEQSLLAWLPDDEIVKAELQYNGFSTPANKKKIN